MRTCRSCAGTVADGCTFPGRRRLCADCIAHPLVHVSRNTTVQTRASYRRQIAARARKNPGQMDWVNLVRPPQ